MKKTILSIIFLVILLLVPTMVFAAEDVAQVGTETFETFEEALEAAKANGEEIVILKTIQVNKDITINIDGVNIKGDPNPLFEIKGGSLKVEGTGTINGTKDVFDVYGNYDKTTYETTSIKSELVIGAGVTVTSGECCIYIKGNGAKADVYGKLTSTVEGLATIQGNGNAESGKTVINIYEGASVIHSDNDLAIYHPQAGKLTVNGGTIKGTTGIEMRAGELVVNGGTIEGTAIPSSAESNGNGSASKGAGIALVQHTTALNTSILVTGGTIKGHTALYQETTETTADTSKVSLKVEGGNFEAINGGTNAVYSKDKEEFITGGTFNKGVTEEYIAGTVTTVKGENGETLIGEKHSIKIEDSANGKVTASLSEAVKGQTVALTVTPKDGYKLKSLTVITAADSKVTVTDDKFVMPNMGVIVTAEFEEASVATDSKPEVKPEQKDETPKMGAINVSYVWVALAAIALVGIATTKKVSKHSK
ncbi:MAG: hypothetical protein IJE68_03655 [Clostridia bacterium]|nr:hypothetical protein [Clostridia bacterium]